jgi:hypothetical protein
MSCPNSDSVLIWMDFYHIQIIIRTTFALKAHKLDISDEETWFELVLNKHCRMLAHYKVKWESDAFSRTYNSSSCSWPQGKFLPDESPASKTEMRFYQWSLNYHDNTMYCQ